MRTCPLVVLAACAAASLPAYAGLSPESVVVVVNADSWASITVANEYIHLRHIPESNIVLLQGLEAFDVMSADQFRAQVLGPTLKAIETRGLQGHIDCITYSVDLPSAVAIQSDMAGKQFQQVITPVASANGVTYLHEWFMRKDTEYLRLDINRYSRRTLPLAVGAALSAAEREAYQQGMALYDAKEYAKAAKVLAPIAATPRNDPSLYYNLACCLSLAGDGDGAMAALTTAVSIGWRNHGQTASDPDLAVLRDRKDFGGLIERMKAQKVAVQPTRGFRASAAWGPQGDAGPEGPHYMLSTLLGVSSGRGNSVMEVVDGLKRAAQADASAPSGTVYFMRNGDVRSTTRDWAFAQAMAELKGLGVECLTQDGILPDKRTDVAGAVIGFADFKWSASGSRILPGAICEHLTSCGGMMGERDTQTPCTEFITAGAAGTSGAVTEPYALQEKFPNAFMHVHYAKGSTLAEAFYQSLEGPYQLLIIGDPLCRPWGATADFSLDGIADGGVISATQPMPTLTPRGIPTGLTCDYYLDGGHLGQQPSNASFPFNPSTIVPGVHTLAVVATRSDALETRLRLEVPVTIVSEHAPIAIKSSVPARITRGKPLILSCSCPGASWIDLMHLGRVVGHGSGDSADIVVDTRALGLGHARLVPVARFAGKGPQSRVIGAPVVVEVDAPVVSAAAGSGGSVSAKGLGLSVDGGAVVPVADTFDPAWIAASGVSSKPFEVVGTFEIDHESLHQVQIRTNTKATVEIDGVALDAATGNGWSYLPARLAAGTHHMRIRGTYPTNPGEARLDLRCGERGTQHPNQSRFTHEGR